MAANMPITFLDDVELPADGPVDEPHVIDIDSYEAPSVTGMLKLWDAVATMLFTISATTLDDFLDLGRPDFRIVIASTGHDERMVVWRKDSEVFVGDYFDKPDFDVYEWDHIARCEIDDSGSWTVKYASYGLYSKRDWESVWSGSFREEVPGQANIADTGQDKHVMASKLARTIMDACPWPQQYFNWSISSDQVLSPPSPKEKCIG